MRSLFAICLAALPGLATAQAVVVQNAAAVIGANAKDIAVPEDSRTPFSGRPLGSAVYAIKPDSLGVASAKRIRTALRRTIQPMTYSVGREFRVRQREIHKALLSEIGIAR